MTSYTKKLYSKNPSAAVAVHNANRMRYGKHTTLLCFSLDDAEDARIAVGSEHKPAHIEDEFDVSERLNRWSDRGWK